MLKKNSDGKYVCPQCDSVMSLVDFCAGYRQYLCDCGYDEIIDVWCEE